MGGCWGIEYRPHHPLSLEENTCLIDEVSRLMESAREETRERVVRDVSEVQDLVLDTMIDVARNDSSGSARVSAVRALKEYMDQAEERANAAGDDLMSDKSGEINAILEHIRQEIFSTGDSSSVDISFSSL